MPQSLANMVVHAVFGTKYRRPLLRESVWAGLRAHTARVLYESGCTPLRVGGVEDHVHLLFRMSRTVTLAHTLQTVKASSSRWLKTQGPSLRDFHWQGGYGVFSVSPRHVNTVIRYIANQKEHHRARTFQQEYLETLGRNGVAFDERYVWD